uniref:Uncharacterized protein n=1 Tax=Anguilla anguilla TaxID=7936 RepID=A0A0E9SRA6_ANGAN
MKRVDNDCSVSWKCSFLLPLLIRNLLRPNLCSMDKPLRITDRWRIKTAVFKPGTQQCWI